MVLNTVRFLFTGFIGSRVYNWPNKEEKQKWMEAWLKY